VNHRARKASDAVEPGGADSYTHREGSMKGKFMAVGVLFVMGLAATFHAFDSESPSIPGLFAAACFISLAGYGYLSFLRSP
jgi:hypothetical protein